MNASTILACIDATLEKMAFRQMEVRAIYLTELDHASFDKAMSRRYRIKGSFLAYGDYQIRRGTVSKIYSTHGVETRIKQLSPRVREAA